jgi:hypothetical protein
MPYALFSLFSDSTFRNPESQNRQIPPSVLPHPLLFQSLLQVYILKTLLFHYFLEVFSATENMYGQPKHGEQCNGIDRSVHNSLRPMKLLQKTTNL